jgi:hypothetical protein
MATEKQIAANRANALRSTGPKTIVGKLKSSRNAFKHGLSAQLIVDPLAVAKIDVITRKLVGASVSQNRVTLALDFASAQIDLLRIRSARAKSLADSNIQEFSEKELKRLAALDRYERYALNRRRRAARQFEVEKDSAG